MKKRNLAAWAIAFFSVVALSTSAVYADSGHCAECAKKDGSLSGKFFKKIGYILPHQLELGLSEEQVKKIEDLKWSVKKADAAADGDINKVKVDIGALLYQDKIDVKAVNALLDKKYDLKKAQAKIFVQALADLKETLTPAQLQAVKFYFMTKKSCPGGKPQMHGETMCPFAGKK